MFLSNTTNPSCVRVCVTQKLFTVDDTDDDACISVVARVGRILAAQLVKVVGIWNKRMECLVGISVVLFRQ